MEIIQKYASDCICINETHGLNTYHFNITTGLVLDNMRKDFSCTSFSCV